MAYLMSEWINEWFSWNYVYVLYEISFCIRIHINECFVRKCPFWGARTQFHTLAMQTFYLLDSLFFLLFFSFLVLKSFVDWDCHFVLFLASFRSVCMHSQSILLLTLRKCLFILPSRSLLALVESQDLFINTTQKLHLPNFSSML